MTSTDKDIHPRDNSGKKKTPEENSGNDSRNAQGKDEIETEISAKVSDLKSVESLSEECVSSAQAGVNGIMRNIIDFYEKYKAEIGLVVLLGYVVTLAIATIIELIQH